METLTDNQRALALRLLADTGMLTLTDAELASLVALHTRFIHDRALVTASVPLDAEPAVTLNPAERRETDERA